MPNGYGLLTVTGQNITAHRFSMSLILNRPLQRGEVVCHSCDVQNCVRPDHLFLGTQADNLADARAKGRAFPPSHNGRRKNVA
jgi:hypothetical protein